MSDIECALKDFLADKSRRVAVIKGDWGVGKTYCWNEMWGKTLREHSVSCGYQGYSYISLFGVKHQSDLKKLVFSSSEIFSRKNLKYISSKIGKVARFSKSLDIPYIKDTDAFSEMCLSRYINDMVICIDDLERKEDNLSVSSVLGFISHLKTEKNCKIILIFNEEQVLNKERYAEYREKVVDLELQFNPTIDSNLKIVWPKDCPASIQKAFSRLELGNIRIMQKVKWGCDYFSFRLKDTCGSVWPIIEERIAHLTILYHHPSSTASLEEVSSSNSYSLLYISRKDEDVDASRFDVVKNLQAMPTEFDDFICEYLKSGHVNLENYHGLLDTGLAKKKADQARNGLHAIWDKFRVNFSVSHDDFVQEMSQYLQDNIDSLMFIDVSQSVDFIQELTGQEDQFGLVEKCIDKYISENRGAALDRTVLLHVNEKYVEMLQDRLSNAGCSYSMGELFDRLADRNGWTPKEIEYMKDYTEDDYYEWMSSETTRPVLTLIETFLSRFQRIEEETNRRVCDRIKSALVRISKRSRLDYERVKSIVDIESKSNGPLSTDGEHITSNGPE